MIGATSYWQRGCDDGRARRPRQWPDPQAKRSAPTNESYDNGYIFGRRQQFMEEQAAENAEVAHGE